MRNGIFFIILQHTNNLKQLIYENLGNNKYHFKNKSNEKEKDSNNARHDMRSSARSMGTRQVGRGV